MKKIQYFQGELIGSFGVRFLHEVITEKGKKRKAAFLCPLCGSEFEACIYDVKINHTTSCGCKKTKDISLQRYGNCVAIEKAFQDSNKRWVWKCRCDCGTFFTTPLSYLTQGITIECPKCTKKRVLESKKIDFTGEEIDSLIVLYYTGKQDKKGNCIWHCRCSCGKDVEVSSYYLNSPHWTYKSCGCQAHKSAGELKITSCLKNMNIDFIKEKTFETCINPITNYKLRFDFYLPKQDILIEYDGEQHFFTTNTYWSTEKTFYETKKRDGIKNEWALLNNKRLIRIPYTQYNCINEKFLKDLISSCAKEGGEK